MSEDIAQDLYKAAVNSFSPSPRHVQHALRLGADVDGDIGSTRSYRHALKHLLGEKLPQILLCADSPPSPFSPNAVNDALKSIQLILDAGPNLQLKSDTTGATMLDLIIGNGNSQATHDPRWIEPASDAVIYTLHDNAQKNAPVYAVDFASVFAFLGEPSRTWAMDSIQAVHHRVYERLSTPRTPQEQRLHDDPRFSWWQNPFDRPDTNFLPHPTQEMLEAHVPGPGEATPAERRLALMRLMDTQDRQAERVGKNKSYGLS